MHIVAVVLAQLAFGAPLAASKADPAILAYWNDGRAEVDGYALTQPRYGQLRRGSAALIFVKEDFSNELRVKADPGKHPPSDVFPALKLNVNKHFQTGIYDYSVMSSVFAALEPRGGRQTGAPVKIAFSAQEWCGMVFEEILFDAGAIREKRFSYFDGEADLEKTLPVPEDGITVDEIPILVRGFTTLPLEPGASRSLSLLPSLERSRLAHRPLAWTKGTLSRSKTTKRLNVPFGQVEVETWTAELGGERYEYDVEQPQPRRLIEWRGPEGEVGRLLGSERLKYWEMNKEGGEKALPALGLKAISGLE